jgi:hypothetical protein
MSSVARTLAALSFAGAVCVACGLSEEGTGTSADLSPLGDASVDATSSSQGGMTMTGADGSTTVIADAAPGADASTGSTADASTGPNADAGADSGSFTYSYVGRIGATTASMTTTITLNVGATAAAAGDAIIVAVLLSTTSSGSVTATDSAGNTYAVAVQENDGSANDRLIVLTSITSAALGAGGHIDVAFPSTKSAMATADAFRGVAALESKMGVGNNTPCTNFDSSSVTVAHRELLVGVVGIENGSPTWSIDWTALQAQSSSGDTLTTAYRVIGTGTTSAAGTCSGDEWMAAILAFH